MKYAKPIFLVLADILLAVGLFHLNMMRPRRVLFYCLQIGQGLYCNLLC